ncbi:unnamed protein product [Parnassius apollo]|uniref:(apollo) hypothetical protein n=1 Tax=Parnassius apollo TaxID=110799 RepID=A0A8S3XXK6_PARAO|nr:unnamed protein product [Parnassius apollo]
MQRVLNIYYYFSEYLIGKDITHKLYSVSEGLGIAGTGENDSAPTHLTRSASVDAVHEGARGRLRSVAWRARTTAPKGNSYWQPVVARQFLRQSPFGRAMLPPKLLTQASSASLQPSSNRRREVKFAETPITTEPPV